MDLSLEFLTGCFENQIFVGIPTGQFLIFLDFLHFFLFDGIPLLRNGILQICIEFNDSIYMGLQVKLRDIIGKKGEDMKSKIIAG